MNKYFDYDKVIYQTYECNFSQLHDKFKETAQTWIDHHPGWKYHFSSAEKRKSEVTSILNLSKNAIDAYDGLPGVIQGDIWRFLITAHNGGMYADLDSIALSNVENVIDKLEKQVDIIATPEGYQIITKGSNTSNYVFGKNTFLGKELTKIIYEFLEMSGHCLKNQKHLMLFNTMAIWPEFIDKYKDRVAQTYSPEYFIHGKGLKPPSEWTNKFEKPRLGPKTECPNIYTAKWDFLYNEAKVALSQ